MKGKRFKEEQIIRLLQEAESGHQAFKKGMLSAGGRQMTCFH